MEKGFYDLFPVVYALCGLVLHFVFNKSKRAIEMALGLKQKSADLFGRHLEVLDFLETLLEGLVY